MIHHIPCCLIHNCSGHRLIPGAHVNPSRGTCSDGLWGEVEDEDIEAILNHYQDPRVCCRELVRASHHGGGKDNVTVMLVHVE